MLGTMAIHVWDKIDRYSSTTNTDYASDTMKVRYNIRTSIRVNRYMIVDNNWNLKTMTRERKIGRNKHREKGAKSEQIARWILRRKVQYFKHTKKEKNEEQNL